MSRARIVVSFVAIAALCYVESAKADDPTADLDTNPVPEPTPASLHAAVRRVKTIDANCPSPTRQDRAGACVLDADAILTEPLLVSAGVHLNCRGHKLGAAQTGTADRTATPTVNEYVPSVPPAAIIVLNGVDVKVQNCVIEGTDFGIWAVNTMDFTPPPSPSFALMFQENVITAKYFGYLLDNIKHSLIAGGTVRFGIEAAGVGIQGRYDVDHNVISGVTLIADSSMVAATRWPAAPGGPLLAPFINAVVFQAFSPDVVLLNLSIDGRDFQLAYPQGNFRPGLPDDGFIDPEDMNDSGLANDNVIDGNTVYMHRAMFSGINAGGPSNGLRVSNNTVYGDPLATPLSTLNGGDGFHQSMWTSGTFPGTCRDDPGRYCLTDGDCAGTACTGVVAHTNLRWGAHNDVVSGNTVVGPVLNCFTVSRGSLNAVVDGNRCLGPARNGIILRQNAVESTTVSNNEFRGSLHGMAVYVQYRTVPAEMPRFFGSSIFLNDIHDDAHAVSTGACVTQPGRACFDATECASGACVYPIDTLAPGVFELSVGDVGNYWGHSLSPGFEPSDSSSYPLMKDSHPFCEPVAGMDRSALPTTCP
jgi:hypothetical protein